jgi:hypothetical protein
MDSSERGEIVMHRHWELTQRRVVLAVSLVVRQSCGTHESTGDPCDAAALVRSTERLKRGPMTHLKEGTMNHRTVSRSLLSLILEAMKLLSRRIR